MPFQPGNKLWEKAQGIRKENKKREADFHQMMISGAIGLYYEQVEKMYTSEGKKIPAHVKEAMDRTEKLLPYGLSKKAPVDTQGETVRPILVLPAELVDKNNNKDE